MPLSKPINNFVSAIRDAFSGDCCKHRRSDNKNQMASGRKITVLSRDNITSPPGKQKISDGLSCGTTTSAHLLNVKSTVAFTQNITSDMATSPSLSVKRSTPPAYDINDSQGIYDQTTTSSTSPCPALQVNSCRIYES